MDKPTVADVRAYSNGELKEEDWNDSEVLSALIVEEADQAIRCDVPAIYPPQLAEMLKRRVLLNLRYRKILSPAQTGNEWADQMSYIPANDPIVAKYEKPFRKVVLA